VTDPEFPGVSEFFVDEVAHSINLGRGTAAFRARRAWTWRANLPATRAALRDGRIDERRAGVLADALQHTTPGLARAVEADVLPGACDLAPAALRRRALALLAELDADAVDTRREEAERAADVRVSDAGDGMAALTADLRADDAAACFDLIDQLAHMARSDGDPRPIGQLRAAVLSMLVLRPADHGLAGARVELTVTACLDGLEGTSSRGGEVEGFTVTAAHLRDLLRRVGALGLTAPAGGSLAFALTDATGRLVATAIAADLARRAARGCAQHPRPADCTCPVLGPPSRPRRTGRPTPSSASSRPGTVDAGCPTAVSEPAGPTWTTCSRTDGAGRPPAPTCAARAGPTIGSRPSPVAGCSCWTLTGRCASPAGPASPARPGHPACARASGLHRQPVPMTRIRRRSERSSRTPVPRTTHGTAGRGS
jgi:hypothetical protein